MKQCVKKESSRLKCNTGASGPETTNSGDLREGSRNIRKSGFCGKKGIGSWHSGSFLSLFLFPNVSALQSAHPQTRVRSHACAAQRVRCSTALASGQSCCFVWCHHVQRRPVQGGPPRARHVRVTTGRSSTQVSCKGCFCVQKRVVPLWDQLSQLSHARHEQQQWKL